MPTDSPLKRQVQEKLGDLFAFQCVLVALRGIEPEASEEMLWQTFLAALVEQYRFRSAWYGCCAGGMLHPIACAGADDGSLQNLAIALADSDHLLSRAIKLRASSTDGDNLALPLLLDGNAEGGLMIAAGACPADRVQRLEILLSEAGAIIHARRSRLRMLDALKESEQRYRALVENTVDWVWQLDAGGRFVYSSARIRELLGYEPEEILRKTPQDILSSAAAARFLAALDPARHACFALTARRRDGREVIFETQSTPWAGGWMGTCRDVTERVRAQEALQAAKDQAEGANRSKTQFLAAMSHEIRTPMNGVIGMTSLLSGTDLSPEQRDCVETIQVSGQALLALIDDILDLSKIEADRLDLERRPFPLRDCVERALELISAQASAKGVELACRFDAAVPEMVRGDGARLRQVLLNLLGNAVKFTAEGEVIVSVAAPEPVNGRRELRFGVRDTGIGIPAEKIGRLFQPFVQADSSTSRRFGGTGLGLAISKRIVEKMNGSIWAESEPGKGSEFHFTIASEFVDTPVSGHLSAAQPVLAGRRLLLVEPNASVREILAELASRWGMAVAAVASEREAVERIEGGESFDAAVLAFGGGTSPIISHLRSHAPAMKLILMTSLADRVSGMRAPDGCASLVKPIRPSQLHASLLRALSEIAGGEAGRVESRPGFTPAARALRILVAEDDRISQKVIDYTLKRLGYTARIVGTGAEAVAAVQDESFDLVLMDVQMPGMDGLEATRRIRRHCPPERQPRIVAMTAAAFREDRDRCLDAGMDDYVSKPVEIEDVAKALDRARKVN